MPLSLLPRGPSWWPEHPLETLGIREPTGSAVAGEPDAEPPASRGGVGQAGPWGGSVGRPARPQVLSRLASEDAASCSDSRPLLGLELVVNWVSEAVNGAGLQARPAHRRRGSGPGERPSAEPRRGGGSGGGCVRSK